MLSPSEQAELAALEAFLDEGDTNGPEAFAKYYDDCAGFALDHLGTRLWDRQVEICDDLIDNPRVAVRSGHKIGKTRLIACIALWWVCTRPRGLVICTSSVDRQVKTQIWREISKLYAILGGKARFGVECPKDPSTGILFDEYRAIYGFTTRDAEAMAGYSSDQLLFVIDEASGFSNAIYEAVRGNMAGGGRIIATGNPTTTSGWFFEAFTKTRAMWKRHIVDSRTVPNITGNEAPIPGLATQGWVDEMLTEFGEESAVFAVRVAGNPPLAGDRAVVPLGLVEAGAAREVPLGPSRLQIGVDVAREGSDDSTIYARRGLHMFPSKIIHGYDNVDVAGEVMLTVEALRHPGDVGQMTPVVKVDVIGTGSGVVDHLRRMPGIVVVPVDVSRKSEVKRADGSLAYNSLRAEVWFSAREWLEDGGAFPADGQLESELIAAQYDHDNKLRRRVDSKDKLKERLGGQSPDRADGFCLCTYEPPIPETAVEDISGFKSRERVQTHRRKGDLGVW